jgi:DNA-binding transcriptional regulator PaaX
MKIKQIRQNVLPVTKQILTILSDVAFYAIDNILELYPSRINQHIYGNYDSLKLSEKFYQEQRIKRALRKLKKQKYLETKRVGNRILYKLTTKGLHQALLARIKTQTKILPDNQFCLACFDIPESARHLRRALRRIFKNMQLKQLQKSVWYTNKDIFDLLTLYIENLEASDWVKVVLASKIK